MFKQRLQFVLLIERTFCTDDFKSGLIAHDQRDRLVGNECTFA